MTIKSILCPTDLTSGSDQALRYALALARAYGARLTAFHCEPPNREDEVMQTQLKASFEESLFQHLGPAELATIDWERVIEQGSDPGDAIVEFAAERSVDLIVMRSRRRPHRAALLGSTAESVCRSAPCPVLVMHTDERDWVDQSTYEVRIKRVLVAYDFSDYAELALNYGLSFAQEYQAELPLDAASRVCRPPRWTNRRFRGTRPARKALITEPRAGCKRPCPLKRICGVRLSMQLARANPTERFSITRNEIRSISFVWERTAPDSGCAPCLDQTLIESCGKRLVRC